MDEAGSRLVSSALEAGPVAISRISLVEVASALCRRGRGGELAAADRDRLLAALAADEGGLHVVELTPAVVTEATRLLRRHDLRAADATQLASCLVLSRSLEDPPRFLTFDDRQARAAESEGLPLSG